MNATSTPPSARATACQAKVARASLRENLQIQSGTLERVLLVVFILSLPLVNPWVHGDGVGYYAYARAPLIQHNLDFRPDYVAANDSFRENRLDENGVPKAEFRTSTGHLDNHFTVGPAILWLPFLLAAHGGVLLARALGSSVRADGFSAPYRYAMAFGTALYGFLALLLAFRLARKYVDPAWALVATLAIWWASSLPVYMYFNPSWSHAHSAFSVTLFLWYWERTGERRNTRQWIVLGLITGLMLNVYYANLMVVAILLVEALWHYPQIFKAEDSGGTRFSQLLFSHLLFGAVVVVSLSPTFVSRSIVYGGPFETGYLSIRDFLWSAPVLFSVLFSANHGLLSWTPVVAFSVVGLILFARRVPRVGVPFLSACLAFYLFFSLYPDWAGISSYGNRFFLSLTALFILGLAVSLESFASLFARQSLALRVAALVLGCFTLWNLGLMYQWGTHLIPARGPISFSEAVYNQFHVVPRGITSHLRSYFLRRSDLMRQLEKKDIEQLNNNAP